MKNTPIDSRVVESKIKENHLTHVGTASIREIKKLVDDIEAETGQRFVRMEMGIPGLPATQIGIDAEVAVRIAAGYSVPSAVAGRVEIEASVVVQAEVIRTIAVARWSGRPARAAPWRVNSPCWDRWRASHLWQSRIRLSSLR